MGIIIYLKIRVLEKSISTIIIIYVDYHKHLNIVKIKRSWIFIRSNAFLNYPAGNFLSNIEYEWLDTFKSEISNEVINTYLHFAHSGRPRRIMSFSRAANFIFYFDPVTRRPW